MPTDRHVCVLKEAMKIRVKLRSLSTFSLVSSKISPKKKSPNKSSLRRLPVFLLVFLTFLIVPLVAMGGLAVADPAGDISAKQSQAESIKSEIASLNSQLEAKVESYNYANVELERIQNSIKETEAKLAEATVTLRETQERLDRRITNIYRYGSVNILDVLMGTSDLSDFLSTCDMLAKVGEQDRNDVEQVKMLKAQIEEAQNKLANDKASHEALVAQLASEKSEIEAGLAERQSMLASVEGEIAALAQQQQAARVAAFQDNSATSYGGDEGNYGPAPAPRAGGVVAIAMQYLGVPYVWGGASPAGFDCSGLVMYVYAQVGIYLPHSAAAQYAAGTPISYGELAPGDLVFFGSGGISHVGIYIGGGSMIHAPFEGEVVQIAPVSAGGAYRGACRL